MPDPAAQNLVTVYTTTDSDMAAGAEECLRNDEIPYSIKRDNAFGMRDEPLIRCEFTVPEKHANRSRAILSRWEYLAKAAKNPFCISNVGSRGEYQRTFPNSLAFFIYFLIVCMQSLTVRGWGRLTAVILISFIVFLMSITYTMSFCYLMHLRRLGYEWVSWRDANDMIWKHWRSAYRIPAAADVELIPGFKRDAENLDNFLKFQKEYKREIRRKK